MATDHQPTTIIVGAEHIRHSLLQWLSVQLMRGENMEGSAKYYVKTYVRRVCVSIGRCLLTSVQSAEFHIKKKLD